MTKLMVSRYETDSAGKKAGISVVSPDPERDWNQREKTATGGTYCKKDSFVSDGAAEIFFNGCGHVPHVFAGRGMDPGI